MCTMGPWFAITSVLVVLTAFWSQERVRNRLLRKLLDAQKIGDKKAFVHLLDTVVAHLYLSKLTRIIMVANFALAFEDTSTLERAINSLVAQPYRNREFAICLMKAYTFELDRGSDIEALKLENSLRPLQASFPEIKEELRILHQLYIEHNPDLVMELRQKISKEKAPEAQLVLLYRLSKLEELLGKTEAAAIDLDRLRHVAKENIQVLD